jgi:hypothetical protein
MQRATSWNREYGGGSGLGRFGAQQHNLGFWAHGGGSGAVELVKETHGWAERCHGTEMGSLASVT